MDIITFSAKEVSFLLDLVLRPMIVFYESLGQRCDYLKELKRALESSSDYPRESLGIDSKGYYDLARYVESITNAFNATQMFPKEVLESSNMFCSILRSKGDEVKLII